MDAPLDTPDYGNSGNQAGLTSPRTAQQRDLCRGAIGQSVAFSDEFLNLQISVTGMSTRLDDSLERFASRLEDRIKVQSWMLATLIVINMAMFLKLFLP